jgi:hypothetical protein
MSDQKKVIEGVEFTDAEVERLAELLKSADFVLWKRIGDNVQSIVAEEGMSLPNISERMLWECRGAYQVLRRLGFVKIAVEDMAHQIMQERSRTQTE